MKDIILQRWAQTTNKELGDSIRAFTIQLIREGGLTYVGTCPEDNLCLPPGPTLTTAQINEAFATMLATIDAQNESISNLEDAVTDLQNRVTVLENP